MSTLSRRQRHAHVNTCIDDREDVMERRKKRREFAQMRDAECAGMTEEEKQEWMKKMRDQSRCPHVL